LKWLRVLRTCLVRSSDLKDTLLSLRTVVCERDSQMSLQQWMDALSGMLPEAEQDILREMNTISALLQGHLSHSDTDMAYGKSI